MIHRKRLENVRLIFLFAVFSVALFSFPTQANASELSLSEDLKDHILTLDEIPTNQSETFTWVNRKVTIVTFFASWCPPCLDEFRALNQLNAELENDISIVAINVFEAFDENDEPRMKRFLNETKPSFPLVKGTEETLKLFGDVNRIPTLHVFDQNGTKAFTFIHVRNATKQSVDTKELREAIIPLL